MKLLESFGTFIKQNNLFSAKDKLVIAVSGGVDSIVLCELCKQAGYNFIIAHCNFQLRGEESLRDENFVKNLGERYQVEVKSIRFDTESYAKENKISIQEAARELRYDWFFKIVQELMPQPAEAGKETNKSVPGWHVGDQRFFVLTAHHADDNAETVAMNFFRGTGLHGLTGIPIAGDQSGNRTLRAFFLRRPLLPFFKEELLQFARENKLQFVEDSSNQSSKYTRNFFRNEVLPAISKVYPQVKDNLQDNIKRFGEIERLYQISVGEIVKKLCRQKGEEVHIPIKQLLGYNNKALVYEVIASYGFSEKQVDEVLKLAEGDSGSYIDSPAANYRIIKHRHWFIISPSRSPLAENIIIEEKDTRTQFSEGVLRIEKTGNKQPVTGHQVACLDAKEIQFPLLLRKWKAGDYFYPLGMKKKKKLARFFIDQKLSKTSKEKAWVIEMNKKIIWIVGMRIDERFKITESTSQVLQLSFQPNK
ncbi:MAG TPA: tRNA lysidine(34) synthetase TilS [Chitinophagaceae bacterium]|nr:tRNA lysidine(34) synthetase TilS [Chitinophagaceae bacterium]